jgi:hydrogenase maturation protease
MSQPSILIAGIGNIFLGDDAFGCEVVKRLSQRTWPDNVRVIDYGIRGFDLAYALLDGCDVTIFVDATPRGDAPGTLYTIEPDLNELELLGTDAVIETHGMNPLKVLRLVKTMGGEFKTILLVGCEPETFGPEEGLMGLSKPVADAVPVAMQVVESLVAKHLAVSLEAIA